MKTRSECPRSNVDTALRSVAEGSTVEVCPKSTEDNQKGRVGIRTRTAIRAGNNEKPTTVLQ